MTDEINPTVIGVGNIVDNADVIVAFENNVRLLIQGITAWHSAASMPGQFPTAELGNLVQPGPNEGELTPTIVAQKIADSFALYTKNYTSIRNCRFVRTLTGYGVDYDSTQITSLTDAYDQPARYPTIDGIAVASGIAANQIVKVAEFNTYISNLYAEWSSAKDNLVTFTATYCHSNCHGSCHGSRRHR